jgi:hypothetical protein
VGEGVGLGVSVGVRGSGVHATKVGCTVGLLIGRPVVGVGVPTAVVGVHVGTAVRVGFGWCAP